jgi:hypothetical protein
MTDFNSYTTHCGHHCSDCFMGSRTDRFQGDADLLQTCKMGLERGNYTSHHFLLWEITLKAGSSATIDLWLQCHNKNMVVKPSRARSVVCGFFSQAGGDGMQTTK